MERMPDPMGWLAAGVPLTLLIDLLDEAGPRSDAILRDEPGDMSWLVSAYAA